MIDKDTVGTVLRVSFLEEESFKTSPCEHVCTRPTRETGNHDISSLEGDPPIKSGDNERLLRMEIRIEIGVAAVYPYPRIAEDKVLALEVTSLVVRGKNYLARLDQNRTYLAEEVLTLGCLFACEAKNIPEERLLCCGDRTVNGHRFHCGWEIPAQEVIAPSNWIGQA